ncbi:MAG: glycosyl transferase family 2 [uncultured bacterium]|nr:MAG: glycosyl transferase family 2 [uncultured bacterium]KKU15394.1 MAG: Glycosyl transferase family 2 [Microgenomates group bacterium GW2011_GWC2_45_8]KKU26218.1 MAG: Glycosyl transferase family 2 [Microgenomates group bacterium GW2011_GWA2_46_16]
MLSISTQIAREDSLVAFEAMLKSVTFADEIVIFNMERTDQSALTLFKQFKARVINIKTPVVVEEIRADQVTQAQGDWVLVMDYDEIIPSPLKDEILTLIGNLASCSAYAIARDNFSLGSPLKHGGWEQDYVVRLVRHADFIMWPTNIHSSPQVRGCTIKTVHSMEHHKDPNLDQMIKKTNRYSEIEADLFFKGGLPRVTSFTLIRKSVMEFVRRYFLKRGFLDGRIGLIQSLYQGYSVFISYAKLYEKQRAYNKHGSNKIERIKPLP